VTERSDPLAEIAALTPAEAQLLERALAGELQPRLARPSEDATVQLVSGAIRSPARLRRVLTCLRLGSHFDRQMFTTARELRATVGTQPSACRGARRRSRERRDRCARRAGAGSASSGSDPGGDLEPPQPVGASSPADRTLTASRVMVMANDDPMPRIHHTCSLARRARGRRP